MIHAVIFDFDDTLVDFRAGDEPAIGEVIRVLPKRVDRDDFFAYSVDIVRAAYDAHSFPEENLHRYRLRSTVERFGMQWDERYLRKFLGVYLKRVHVIDGVVETLQRLAGRVRLGLLTNAADSPEQNARIDASGLRRYFDYCAVSADIGVFKPDRAAFEHVAEHLGARAGECAFVGDSEAYDVRGARQAGMVPLKKLDNRNRHEPSDANDVFESYGELGMILSAKFGLN